MGEKKGFDRAVLDAALTELGGRAFSLALVEKFYPQNMFEPKTGLGLEKIFSILDIQADDSDTSSSMP